MGALVFSLVAACAPAPTIAPSAVPSTPPRTSEATTGPTADLTPSTAPTPAPSPFGSVQMPLLPGRTMDVALVGDPGVLTGWRPATARQLGALDFGDRDIAVRRSGDRDVVLGWVGTICDVQGTLDVTKDGLVVTMPPRQGCDAQAVTRGLVLTFADAVDPQALSLELVGPILLR